jgi:linoleoyl-CoA desaturase
MAQDVVKFSKQNTDFVSELRDKVREYFELNKLSKYGNTSILFKTLVMASLYIVPFIMMLTGIISMLPLVLLCWMAMGFGMAGLGMVIMHDANHGSLSRSAKVNKLMGYSLYILGGFPPNWQYQHNILHHGYTNIDGYDEDIASGFLLRFSPHTPLNRIHKYQSWYAWFLYSLMTFSWITITDFKRFYSYKKRHAPLSNQKSYNRMFVELIASKVVYYSIMLVLPLILIPVGWYWIVIGFFLMHAMSGLTLSTIFQTAHVMPTTTYPVPDENGSLENSWAVHQLMTTSNFAPKSKVLTWLIGGLNFQVEHHLFPYISHVHYPKLSLIVKNLANKYNLPYNVQQNFFIAVINHFRMLKLLGT